MTINRHTDTYSTTTQQYTRGLTQRNTHTHTHYKLTFNARRKEYTSAQALYTHIDPRTHTHMPTQKHAHTELQT